MKKSTALLLALIILFTFAACGSSDKDDEPTVDAVADEIEEYIEANGDKLIEIYESLNSTIVTLITPLNCTATIEAKDRGFILKYKTDIDTSSETLDSILNLLKSFGYDENSAESIPDEIKNELPNLEYFRVLLCDKDGDSVFKFNYK